MPTLALLPTNLHTLPSRGALTEYRDTEERGLALRVYASGVRTWVVVYRFGGRRGATRRYKLGRLERVGLAEARRGPGSSWRRSRSARTRSVSFSTSQPPPS